MFLSLPIVWYMHIFKSNILKSAKLFWSEVKEIEVLNLFKHSRTVKETKVLNLFKHSKQPNLLANLKIMKD